MDVCETKNMDLFNKVHNSEPMKVHTFGPNIRLVRLFSLMSNYAKPRKLMQHMYLYALSLMYVLCLIILVKVNVIVKRLGYDEMYRRFTLFSPPGNKPMGL